MYGTIFDFLYCVYFEVMGVYYPAPIRVVTPRARLAVGAADIELAEAGLCF